MKIEDICELFQTRYWNSTFDLEDDCIYLDGRLLLIELEGGYSCCTFRKTVKGYLFTTIDGEWFTFEGLCAEFDLINEFEGGIL